MRKKKIILFLIIGLLSTTSVAFAAAGQSAESGAVASLLQVIVKAASLLWIIPAVVAGKLMTNSFVMGEVVGIDEYLYRFWTIMMIIANLGVAGVLIKMVVDGINDGKLVEKLKGSLGTIVVGVIGIQMSWFAITSLIDIANIAVAGVGAQMNGYISSSFKGSIRDILSPENFKECYRMTKSESNNVTEGGSRKDCGLKDYGQSAQERIDNFINNSILNGNSLTGPLVFLGLGIYKYTDYGYVGNPNMTVNGVTMYMLVQLAMLFFTFVPMRALMIINFLRIGYIWMRLALGPIIVLGWMYQQLTGSKTSLFGDNGKLFDIGNIVALIFQPVISVIGVSLTVIFTMTMYEGMQPKTTLDNTKGVDSPITTIFEKFFYSSKGATTDQESMYGTDEGSFYLDGAVSAGTGIVGGGLGYIIITMFSIFIMRTTIKVSAGFSELTSEAVKNSIDNMKKIATKNIKIGEKGKEVDVDTVLKSMNVNTPLKQINDRLASLGRTQKDDYVESVNKGSIGKMFGLNEVGDIRSDLGDKLKGKTSTKITRLSGFNEFGNITKEKKDDIKGLVDKISTPGNKIGDFLGDDPIGKDLNNIFQRASEAAEKNPQRKEFKFDSGGAKEVLKRRYTNGGQQYIALVHNRPEILELTFEEAIGKKGAASLGRVLSQMAPKKYPVSKITKNDKNDGVPVEGNNFLNVIKNNKPESRKL